MTRSKTIGCLLVVVVGCALFEGCPGEFYEVVRLDAGSGREIVITRESWCDVANAAYYEIRKDGQVLQPRTRLHLVTCGETPRYTVISDGDLVGVFEEKEPPGLNTIPDFDSGETWTQLVIKHSLVMIHDFQSHESYTSGQDFGYDTKTPPFDSRHQELIGRLFQANPDFLNDTKRRLANGIESLYLSGKPVRDIDLRHFQALQGLIVLNLTDCQITDAGISHLRGMKLRRLDFAGTSISDDTIPHLGTLKSLTFVDVRRTAITEEGVLKLRAILPNTTIASDFDEAE